MAIFRQPKILLVFVSKLIRLVLGLEMHDDNWIMAKSHECDEPCISMCTETQRLQ
jgi:hypothetical protein